MILDGCHFQFGSFNSRAYGIIFAHCDTKSFLKVMGDITSNTVFNKKDKSRYLLHDDYTGSPITFDAEIISDDFKAFTQQNRRSIEKALFNKHEYSKLYVDMSDDLYGDSYEYINGSLKRLYFNCRFINPTKLEDGNGLVVGYKFSIECDSCMLWQDAVEIDIDVPSDGNISVEVDTDIGDYTYPEVTIQTGSQGGRISVVNMTDSSARQTILAEMPINYILTMKGDINYLSDSNYERLSNQNFIRLLDGTNRINIQGDVSSIKFKWNNRRFL